MTTQAQTRRRWTRPVCKGVGIVFCGVCAAAVVAFPVVKGMPAGYVPVALGLVAGVLLSLRRVRAGVSRHLMRLPTPRFLLALAGVALALRAAAIVVFPMPPKSDPGYYHENAVKLATGQEYGHPGRRAHYPPGMSLMLAALYGLTGPSVLAAKCLNALLGVAMVLLIHDLAAQALSPPAARWSGLLAAVMPTLVFYSASLGYEILLGCILLGVCDLIVRSRRGGVRGLAVAAVIGALLGFGALVKPICLLVPAICLVGWLAVGARWRALLYTGVCLALMAAVIAPWTARNHRVFKGRFVLISTNGGEVLYAANGPGATGLYRPHPASEGPRDELARDAWGRRQALRWILANPGDFARLALRKAVYTWGTSSTVVAILTDYQDEPNRMPEALANVCKAVVNVFWAMLLTLCLLGAIATDTWCRPALWPAHLLVLYVFALHLVFEALSRHHIPVVGSLLFLAAAGLARDPAEPTVPQPAPDTDAVRFS